MSDFQPIPDEDNIWLRKKRPQQARPASDGTPWGTLICCILCAGNFILILATEGGNAEHVLEYALYPGAIEIWDGAYWGPLTSAFVHFDFLHFFFNLSWLWLFGRGMEKHFGTVAFLILVAVSAYLTSTCQLAFSDNAGIGFSGVNYALFGFLWMARRTTPGLEMVITDGVVKFLLAWLVIAPFISKLGIMPIGNAAHNSGIIIGILAGAAFVLHYKRTPTLAALVLLTIALLVPLFYMPWSIRWNWNEGFRAIKAGRYQDAIDYYHRVLEREPGDEGARHNLDIARGALGLGEDEKWPPAKIDR